MNASHPPEPENALHPSGTQSEDPIPLELNFQHSKLNSSERSLDRLLALSKEQSGQPSLSPKAASEMAARLRAQVSQEPRAKWCQLMRNLAGLVGSNRGQAFPSLQFASLAGAVVVILSVGIYVWDFNGSKDSPADDKLAVVEKSIPADSNPAILLADFDYEALLDLDLLVAEQESELLSQMDIH